MNKDELIGMIIDFAHDLNELCDKSTFAITVSQNGGKDVFLTNTSLFFQLFSTYQFSKNGDENGYYGHVTTILDDVQFKTLLTNSEYKHYIEKVLENA